MIGIEQVLDTADYRTIAEQIPDQWRPLSGFLAVTGMRLGEAAALRVDDIDAGAGLCQVSRTWVPGVRCWYLQSARVVRCVQMPEVIVEALDLDRTDEELFRVDRAAGPGLIHRYRKVWAHAVNVVAADLDRRPRVNALRQMCGAQLLNAGVPVEEVAAQLGSSTLAVLRLPTA
ncbi:tyrosine-type recombinase/integrase [Nocardia sp. SYP-A9097]|uniref:tyrosine-type recombinase/integrase n=1 Tax=Nocardia sp. SYP-A9097 TaxID=2663237 RepID=UPI00129A96FF|nr:tyrosine-type recombinase/integrase [Nocardia sp. SYP-A9097]MRH85981.1 tyrosine-type recombinase/integrase [Nocardia sp. SYP-A9097]